MAQTQAANLFNLLQSFLGLIELSGECTLNAPNHSVRCVCLMFVDHRFQPLPLFVSLLRWQLSRFTLLSALGLTLYR